MRNLVWRAVACVFLAGTTLVLISGSERDDAASFQIQYHQAVVQLAELEFETAIAANRKVPGAFARQTLDQLRKNVTISRRLLKDAKEHSQDDISVVQVSHAEQLAELAADDYRTALESNRRLSNSASKYRLEKTRLKAEIARLRVDMWKEPDSLPSQVDHMHWEIDRLSREILDLQQRIERLE